MNKEEVLKKLREIRSRDPVSIKTSPYLKDSFTDEYGEEHPVSLRNYQKQMILNLLMMERALNGDDTGLGKTISVLSTIGYIWMKEPNYVPIVVTTKSALFQWGSEVQKFMQNIEALTVYGEPHERHNVYREFFNNFDPEKKRLLFLTYDNIMRDMDRAVIKDRSEKPDPQVKKALASARKHRKLISEQFEEIKNEFSSYFDGRFHEIHEHIRLTLTILDTHGTFDKDRPKPPGWDSVDEAKLVNYIKKRLQLKEAEHEVVKLGNEAAPPRVMNGIIDYVSDLKSSFPDTKFMLVMDEMHKLKNHKSQFHQKTALLAKECQRCVGMTATPVKNRLMEFWSLFHIIKPDLYPKITHFQNRFCVMKMQPIGGGRQVPIVVGYRNLDQFVSEIEPYYLSRKKHDVAKELPSLISQEIECELYEVQEELYDMAETGASDKINDAESTGGDMLAALTMVQQAVNSPELIKDEEENYFEGPSSKVDALIDLLQEEAFGRKIIVFSKFEKMISVIERALQTSKYVDADGRERKGYKYVRITGKENDPKIRERNKNLFQDPNSGINIVLITTAGSESINLQAAEHLAFIDMPWSFGDYVQLTGRFIRVGSQHKVVVAHHFLGKKRTGEKTIDHHILQALRSKKKLADKVAGESIKGGLQFTSDISKDVMRIIADSNKEQKKNALLNKVNKKIKSSSTNKNVVEDPPVLVNDIDFSDI